MSLRHRVRSAHSHAERVLCDVLGGRSRHWPNQAAPSLETDVLDAALAHRVAPLIARALKADGAAGWPPAIVAALDRALADEAALEVCRARELQRLLAALRDAPVGALVFEGAALA
jgi:Uncharacterised nucleotidyltransferase